MTEDEMVGWHHQLDGHEFEQALEIGKPGVLQSMGSQRIGHGWVAEQQLYSSYCLRLYFLKKPN